MNRSLPLVCLFAVFAALKTTARQTVTENTFASQEKLLFIENKGQVVGKDGKSHPEILFTGRTANVQLYISANGIQYQFSREHNKLSEKAKTKYSYDEEYSKAKSYATHKMSVELVNANPAATIRKEQQNVFTTNYYLPQCPKGITGVRSFEKITVQNVYPHIDWVIYTKDDALEYDFIVHDGGKPSDIKLAIKDGDVAITPAGKLVMKTSLGQVEEKAPVSFADGRIVPSKFRRNTDGSIGFAVNAQPGKDLRIDPTVTWSTYYGGSGADYAISCAVDSATGNVYMAGYSSSSGLASGGYSNTNAGNPDAMLVKFSSTGARIWATYFGGSGADYGRACALDKSGNIYLAGSTQSDGIVSGGYYTTHSGYVGIDGFLVKFNSSGAHQWSTYYGGTGDDYAFGCATDAGNNVFLTGSTTSTDANSMYTSGAYQTTSGGGKEAYLVKFSSAGSRQWSTYYGGSGDETGWSCATDSIGNVYMAGQTTSSSGIATSGSLGGGIDAYMVKFTSAGSRSWGTYYGGSSDDLGMACTVSKKGKVYLAGTTSSTTGIATTGAFQTAIAVDGNNANTTDGFLAQYNIDGTRSWGTYFGGNGTDNGFSCATDASGNVYLDGISSSTNIAYNGFDNVNQNSYNYDDYIVKFTTLGARVWSSYLGGSDLEIEYSNNLCKTACATDYSGNVYMCGYTASTADIATTGSFQATEAGDKDAFMTKIKDLNVSLPVVKTTTLPDVIAGKSYTATIVGDSGTAPYIYSINYLPPGLNLNSGTGVISGTSTISYSFTTVLKLIDSNGNSARRVITGIPTFETTGSNFDINYYTTNWLISDTSTAGFNSNAGGGPSTVTNSITNIMTGHTVTMNGNLTLQSVNINGSLTNTSTNPFVFTVTGNLTGTGIDTNSYITTRLAANSATTYLGSTSTGRLSLKSLTIDDSSFTRTLFGNVDVYGKVLLSRGVLNTAGGVLSFKSNAVDNGRIGVVSAGSISGNVTVERYIPAKRAWRMLTAPLSNTGSIYKNWQNNGTVIANTGALIWQPGNSNGYTAGGTSSSLRQYSVATNAFTNPTSTTALNIGDSATNTTSMFNNAYSLFITGPYGSSSYIAPSAGAAATTLKATGKIQTGTRTVTIGSHPNAYTYALIGNPYLSAVNFAGLTKTGISNKFWAWDPQRQGTSYGGYVTVSYDAATSGYDVDIASTATAQTQYIQNGQAIFVEMPTSATASVTFHEADKTDAYINSVFKVTGGTATTLRTVLNRNISGTMTQVDGTYSKFMTGYDSTTTDDAAKFYNYDENIALVRDNQYLSIERRPEVASYDTVYYNLYALKQNAEYSLQFLPDQWSATQSQAWVVDRYLDSTYAINLQATDSYSFTTPATAALSYNANRFYLVLHSIPSVPLSLADITLTAQKHQDKVVVNWNTTNEKDLKNYQVEKSADGKQFSVLTVTGAKNAATASYVATDLQPQQGINYYRIKITGNDGLSSYSKTVQVSFDNSRLNLSVFPNPVTSGNVSFSYSNVPEDDYQLTLYNVESKVVYKNQLHIGGNGTGSFSLPQSASSGRYELRLTNNNNQNNSNVSLIIIR